MNQRRPEHDDFWLLSRLVIDQDNVAQGDTLADDQVGRVVDLPSLAYMAEQRAMRAKTLLGLPTAGTRALAALWMDAFMLGAAYQAAKQSTPENHGDQ